MLDETVKAMPAGEPVRALIFDAAASDEAEALGKGLAELLKVNKDKAVWITLLAFGYKGQILKYNTIDQTFDTFDLPSQLNSPVGIALDDKRNLWVTDHGTSIFFNFLPDNKSITEFATSKASERIFGGSEEFFGWGLHVTVLDS